MGQGFLNFDKECCIPAQCEGFVYFTEVMHSTSVVDLNNIALCKVNKSSSGFGEGNERYWVIEQLKIVLQPMDKSNGLMVLPCYDANEDSASLTGQLQLVDK